MCYIVHSIYSYCNVVFSYYTCYNIVQFVVHISYYIAHCTLPSCAGARLLHQAESLSPACCAGARAAVARLLCQAAAAESPRARSAAMLCHPKSLECALIFNCCCLLRRLPLGSMRRVVAGRRSPGPGVARCRGHHPGVARRLRPRGLQHHRCLQRSSGHHQQHPALVRRWTVALGWLEIGVPGIKRGVEKPPSIAGFRDGSALLQPWKAT